LLPSLLGLLLERSFAATAARPAYVEAAANCSTTGESPKIEVVIETP
jgi:hypothetical protein